MDDIFKFIELNNRKREILTDEIIYNDLEEFINNLEIVMKKKIFGGYDGMAYGIFYEDFNLLKDFDLKYNEKEIYGIRRMVIKSLAFNL